MRTLISGFFVALIVATAAAITPSAFAAQVQTDHWRVTVDESSTMRLDFAVEFTGDISPLNASAALTNTDAETTTAPAASTTTATSAPSTTTATSTPAALTTSVVIAPTQSISPVNTTPSVGHRGDILITEFVSDPISGESEWVEIYNTTPAVLMLNGWYIEEGSGKHTLLEGALNPNAYLVVSPISGALNNGGDVIRLFDAASTQIDDVKYGETGQVASAEAPIVNDPQSASLINGAWVAAQPSRGTANPSPPVASTTDTSAVPVSSNASSSSPNTVLAAETTSTTSSDPSYDTDSLDSPADVPTDTSATTTPPADDTPSASIPVVDLSRLRSLPLDSEIVTTGIVAVAPGVLGKQLFYLAGSGVQVYLHSADFPVLARGMRVRVRGVLSQASGETRVKLSQPNDITILGSGDAPQPHDLTADRIGDETEGWLVRLSGVFTERTGGDYTLADDTDSVRVTLKDSAGIVPSFAVGDSVTVVGIVSETRTGFRVLPRAQDDILVRRPPAQTTTDDASDGTVPVGVIREHNDPTGSIAWTLAGIAFFGILAAALVYHARRRILSHSRT